MSGVEGRVIAITGSGDGLGRECALLLAGLGSSLVINDLGGSRDGSGSGSSMADSVVNTLAVEGARNNIAANAVAPLAATRMTEDQAPGIVQFQGAGITFVTPPSIDELADRWGEIDDLSAAAIGKDPRG
jgi:NAD(P)-dependent dehydrogenase (short-subunit alcohol dehydrogenase family)